MTLAGALHGKECTSRHSPTIRERRMSVNQLQTPSLLSWASNTKKDTTMFDEQTPMEFGRQ